MQQKLMKSKSKQFTDDYIYNLSESLRKFLIGQKMYFDVDVMMV